MRLGVMGGTFDPIHIGHLVAAEEARDRYELGKVIFVPSARPPHKGGVAHSSPGDRLEMVRLAIEGNPGMEVSDIEINREGLSFTIDTLHKLHEIYGGDADLYFITGADAILEILTWKKPEELFSQCRFIAVYRPGYSLTELEDYLRGLDLNGEETERSVYQMEIPGIDVSSTSIRARVAGGKPFRYLVPDSVWLYIRENGLYLE